MEDCSKGTKVVVVDIDMQKFIELFNEVWLFQRISRVKQQYVAIKDLKDYLPEGNVLAQMDFAENFSCNPANAVPDSYWTMGSLCLHPVVIYCRENDELNNNFAFVVDDLGHYIGDVYMIQR